MVILLLGTIFPLLLATNYVFIVIFLVFFHPSPSRMLKEASRKRADDRVSITVKWLQRNSFDRYISFSLRHTSRNYKTPIDTSFDVFWSVLKSNKEENNNTVYMELLREAIKEMVEYELGKRRHQQHATQFCTLYEIGVTTSSRHQLPNPRRTILFSKEPVYHHFLFPCALIKNCWSNDKSHYYRTRESTSTEFECFEERFSNVDCNSAFVIQNFKLLATVVLLANFCSDSLMETIPEIVNF